MVGFQSTSKYDHYTLLKSFVIFRVIGFLKRVTILGEIVNLQKVNWPKSQLTKKSTDQKVNLTKSQPEHKITKMLCLVFLASWLFGQLTFWRLIISPSIESNWQKVQFNTDLFSDNAKCLYTEKNCLDTRLSEIRGYESEAKLKQKIKLLAS